MAVERPDEDAAPRHPAAGLTGSGAPPRRPRRDRTAEQVAPADPTVVVDDEPTEADRRAVRYLLDREPQGAYRIAARNARTRWPVVIRNEPLLDDGTPMPTRWWLVGEPERTMVSRLESRGGVHRVEDEVGMDAIAEAHDRYAAERGAALPAGWDGPRPSGGVGGTRRGIKCLHAHYAWHLAGGDDPVGRWVAARLAAGDGDPPPTRGSDASAAQDRLK